MTNDTPNDATNNAPDDVPDDASNGEHAGPPLRIADSPQRVAGMRVPEGWRLPGKPADLGEAAEDAWRQTGFLCGQELRLIEAGLDLQARLAASGYQPSARSMTMAAFASLWSRAFLCTSDAVALVRRGGYQSALPLVRQAVEFVGAQRGIGDEMDEWRRFTHEAYGRHAETRSTEVGLGNYFSGESIAGDQHLRLIYKAASDLGRPNLGPTALFAAAEANHTRYPLIFADQAFHLGWAQVILGWALRVNAAQMHLALHLGQHFPASDDVRAQAAEHVRAVESLLAAPDRGRLEEWVDEHGRRRHLLVEFKRRPGDASQRVLL
ncbi:MAG: hypothetical protein M0R73_09295 [Dehalococcoidia bacterium]|nr:hypothetical protein [Dehalococcoidia bacterium]